MLYALEIYVKSYAQNDAGMIRQGLLLFQCFMVCLCHSLSPSCLLQPSLHPSRMGSTLEDTLLFVGGHHSLALHCNRVPSPNLLLDSGNGRIS